MSEGLAALLTGSDHLGSRTRCGGVREIAARGAAVAQHDHLRVVRVVGNQPTPSRAIRLRYPAM